MPWVAQSLGVGQCANVLQPAMALCRKQRWHSPKRLVARPWPRFRCGARLAGGAGRADRQAAVTAYSTGPDSDVLIGPGFRPHYASDRGKDLGVRSWPNDAWRLGGGTVWGWISYDPQLDLIFYGTGNPGPWNAEQRSGDNKWSAGMFARDPDDAQARWFYFSPHDLFDHGSGRARVVAVLLQVRAGERFGLHVVSVGY